MQELREIRRRRGESLESLARKCGLDPKRLASYERGDRQWPVDVLNRCASHLGVPELGATVPNLSWAEHRKMLGGGNWNLTVDAGQTWADIPSHYEDLYRQLNPQKTPSLAFRSNVRVDSTQEPLGWTQLFEDGAEAVGANPLLLNFSSHHLVDPRGNPLGTGYRAAFRGKAGQHPWIVFPQITLALREGLYRPDGLVYRFGRAPLWALLQLDGGAHQNKKWDEKQDARVLLPTLRFPSHVILGLDFARAFREQVIAL